MSLLGGSLGGAAGGFLLGGPAGAAIGAGLGGGLFGGGQQQQNVTTFTSPWGPQQPYLQNIYGQAQQLYNQGGPQVYPNSTVSPFSPFQTQGIQAQANLAQNPQTTQAATDYYNNVLNGNYLFGGQGFNAALNAANAQIQPMVGSLFEGHGRYGSGAQGSETANQLGNIFAGLYQGERANQQQALGFAPQVQAMGYQNANQLFNAGAAQQSQAQNELSDIVNRYNLQQQRPYTNLSNYAQTIYGSPSFPSQTQPYFRNTSAGALGGALSGAQLGSMFGPWGTAIGAIGGGLLGSQ